MEKPVPTAKTTESRLALDFGQAVTGLLADYPDLAANTLFFDQTALPVASLSYGFNQAPPPADLDKILSYPDSQYSQIYPVTGLNLLLLSDHGSPVFSYTNPLIEQSLSFFHEAGHLAVPGALYNAGNSILFAESAADAFAVVSWLQAHPAEKLDIDFIAFNRAHDALILMTGGSDSFVDPAIPSFNRYTTPVLDRIAVDAGTKDFVSLTPQERVAVTLDYVRAFAPNSFEIYKLENDLYPLRNKWKDISADNLKPIERLADITLKADEKSLTRAFGTRVLKGFLGAQQHPVVTHHFGDLKLAGDQWQNIRAKLNGTAP